MNLKEKLYRLVEPPEEDEDPDLYDILMMIAIIVSIIPLMFKKHTLSFLRLIRLQSLYSYLIIAFDG